MARTEFLGLVSAAIVVQACYRGLAVRWDMRREAVEEEHRQRALAFERARQIATTFGAWRCKAQASARTRALARRVVLRMRQAALASSFAEWMWRVQDGRQERAEQAAAVTLQSYFRCYAARQWLIADVECRVREMQATLVAQQVRTCACRADSSWH